RSVRAPSLLLAAPCREQIEAGFALTRKLGRTAVPSDRRVVPVVVLAGLEFECDRSDGRRGCSARSATRARAWNVSPPTSTVTVGLLTRLWNQSGWLGAPPLDAITT